MTNLETYKLIQYTPIALAKGATTTATYIMYEKDLYGDSQVSDSPRSKWHSLQKLNVSLNEGRKAPMRNIPDCISQCGKFRS